MLLEEKYNINDLPTVIASYSSNMNQHVFNLYRKNESKYKRHLATVNVRYDWAYMQSEVKLKHLPYQALQGIEVW